MVSGKYKSGAYRKKKVRTPGGKTVTRYELRKPKQASCSQCGTRLHGVARERRMGKVARTERVPSRPYAGQFCTGCMRRKLIEEARATQS